MTKKAYKLLRIKNGKLYPLFVLSNQETKIGEWLPAEEGQMIHGKVKSKIGPLRFRPGWHLSEIPLATHIGVKEDGEIRYMHPDHVWCECEYTSVHDYQPEATANGTNKHGVLIPKNAMLKKIPKQGFYRYKTNPNMFGDWIIAGEMKINKILTDDEVQTICDAYGVQAMPRKR